MPGMDSIVCPGVLGAWHAFLTAHARLTEAVDHRLTGAGCVSLSTFEVLMAVERAPDRRLRMHDLADHVALSRSGLTRLVDRLEAEGLLRRERCPSDRRGAFAVLTAAGDDALRTASPVYAQAVSELFGSALPAAEAARVGAVLARAAAVAVAERQHA